jgi:hypothetical protein
LLQAEVQVGLLDQVTIVVVEAAPADLLVDL